MIKNAENSVLHEYIVQNSRYMFSAFSEIAGKSSQAQMYSIIKNIKQKAATQTAILKIKCLNPMQSKVLLIRYLHAKECLLECTEHGIYCKTLTHDIQCRFWMTFWVFVAHSG